MKPARALNLLGCTPEEARAHIEALWLPGMTWENHGLGPDKWHIDHRAPLVSFNLTDPVQAAVACHYTNLQPLWQPDNLRKGALILC